MAYRHSFLILTTTIIVIVSLVLSHGDALPTLPTLSLGNIRNVDPEGVSVSGFSSGGAMSMQFHFVYSQFLKGAGIFAGSPYLCGGNFLLCLVTPGLIDLDLLIARADNNSAQGLIDDVINIADKNVFVYHGQLDTSNRPPNGEKITAMYKHYGANIVVNLETQAEHGMPTNFYGAVCGESAKETEYITNCNYNGAFEMLNHIYDGNLTAPGIDEEEISGELSLFDQNPYFVDGSANNHSMNDTGYAYVPSRCNNETVSCKLHVVFHGCSQYSGMIDDIYVKKTGYLEVAEVNDIIVLFPQTIAISEGQVNPGGCWDTWGFAEPEETSQFGTKLGKQVSAVFSMLQDILQNEN